MRWVLGSSNGRHPKFAAARDAASSALPKPDADASTLPTKTVKYEFAFQYWSLTNRTWIAPSVYWTGTALKAQHGMFFASTRDVSCCAFPALDLGRSVVLGLILAPGYEWWCDVQPYAVAAERHAV